MTGDRERAKVGAFRDDFFWMQRERSGLFPWASHRAKALQDEWRWYVRDRHHRERVYRARYAALFHLLRHDAHSLNLGEQIHENVLLDLFVKALIRAEIRLVRRFVPQRSHEERLTGNLVSEIDAAVFLVKNVWREAAMKRYGDVREIDFFYYDMSKGGALENKTGADLAFLVIVDLPDHPFVVRSLVLQAKKADPNPRIQLKQFSTLDTQWGESAYFLFYDMDLERLSSPLILRTDAYPMGRLVKEAQEANQATVSLPMDSVMYGSKPLSLFLLDDVVGGGQGREHGSFDEALGALRRAGQDREGFDGRLGIVSIGKSIAFGIGEGGLDLSI